MKKDKIEVMLCASSEKIPEGKDWLYEIKYDGYRIVLKAERGKVTLYTRNGLDYTAKFADLAERASEWAGERDITLDGEIILIDKRGVSDFSALQASDGKNATYAVFDILFSEGKDLRDLPLSERKKILAEILSGAPDCMTESKFVIGRGEECLESARKAGLEGIVAKKINSPYRGGRGGDWIKLKFFEEREFVIGGYSRKDSRREGVSSLLLGAYDGSRKLEYAGKVGTGISRAEERKLGELFCECAAEISPFCESVNAHGGEKVFWLEPRLVAQVRYLERTADGRLRNPSYRGLREDIDPREIVSEQEPAQPLEQTSLPLKHPDKIIFPDLGVTKGEVYRYYESVAEKMLGHIGGRILSVVRCHGSVESGAYFNRHPAPSGKAKRITVKGAEGREHEYFYVDSAEELLDEVRLGALEFHAWGSKVESLERPDLMIFDLDPDEGLDIEILREGARRVKELLDSLSLASNLRTSGGKGYHIAVPFAADIGWEKFRAFARDAAAVLARKYPELFTDNMRKERRKGRIYIDWARNTRGATAIAPYSLRARPGAKIAAPIDWSELPLVAPGDRNIRNAPLR